MYIYIGLRVCCVRYLHRNYVPHYRLLDERKERNEQNRHLTRITNTPYFYDATCILFLHRFTSISRRQLRRSSVYVARSASQYPVPSAASGALEMLNQAQDRAWKSIFDLKQTIRVYLNIVNEENKGVRHCRPSLRPNIFIQITLSGRASMEAVRVSRQSALQLQLGKEVENYFG